MNPTTRRTLAYFFLGQNFADGLRTTVAIALPAVVGAQVDHLAAGIVVSTGTLCQSLPDTPGPPRHRRNASLATLALVAGSSLLTGFLVQHRLGLGLEIVTLSFGLTMPLVWGARAGAVGSAGLLALALTLARPATTSLEVLTHTGLLTLGGLWYALLALLAHQALPYRAAQQALGECLHAVAGYLRVKAAFYDPRTDLAADYRRLVQQQVVVNEKQEAARDVLFRTRQIVRETTSTGRRLVLTFTEAVDLYEHVSAGLYDYEALRAAYGPSGVLAEFRDLIRLLASDLDGLGSHIVANRPYAGAPPDRAPLLAALQSRVAALPSAAAPGQPNPTTLRRLLVDLRDLLRRLAALRRYFDEALAADGPDPGRVAGHARFVPHQELSWRAFFQNLTLSSGVFRHAVRMAVAAALAFGVAEGIWAGRHNYWVLMTVFLMLKPGFSLTRERNQQRILGTLGGGALGAAVLWAVPDGRARFSILLVFMVVTYAFQRTKYLVTVVFLTAYLLILFSFLGLDTLGVLEERLADTALGCAIALTTAGLLFPRWESEALPDLLAATLRANLAYLGQLAQRLAGRPVPLTTYKLLRKDVYVASANLAAAFQRMLSEPRRTQRHPTEVHEFVVLNHVLSAQVAALSADLRAAPAPPVASGAAERALTSAQAALNRALARLQAPADPAPVARTPANPRPVATEPAAGARTLSEQLVFVQKVCWDISRLADVLTETPHRLAPSPKERGTSL